MRRGTRFCTKRGSVCSPGCRRVSSVQSSAGQVGGNQSKYCGGSQITADCRQFTPQVNVRTSTAWSTMTSKNTAYGPEIDRLITDRLPALGPGSPNDAVRLQLAALTVEK